MYNITPDRLRVIIQTLDLIYQELNDAGLLVSVDPKLNVMIKDLETILNYDVTGPLIG
jgi:hypothetical protein